MAIKRVLIANRGAIAVRILRTLNKLGLESVIVYHSAEKNLSYLNSATHSVDLGDSELSDNFLNIEKIISIAKSFDCDAIHPGYGFLSENHLFAKACEDENIKFIGPKSDVIQLMGLKSTSKEIALNSGIPVIRGISFDSFDMLKSDTLEYPLLIKAVAGGGGKGLKIVQSHRELKEAVLSAKREALQYFGNDEVILEPYIKNARHIEIQVLGSEHGEIIHLFERECSVQRNHQKIIEEAPAQGLSEGLKKKLYTAAVNYASKLNYTGAGTVEFLVSGSKYWFLEMNTRIQVEHAVTELITGIDIVEQQIHIANGELFSSVLKNATPKGHALELRIYSERPDEYYQPSSGEIVFAKFPKNVRFDTFIETGTLVTSHFDSLLAKLIVHNLNRDEAICHLTKKLEETKILGVDTNINYLSRILRQPDFLRGNISTTFLTENHSNLSKALTIDELRERELLIITTFIYRNFISKQRSIDSLWSYQGPDNLNRILEIVVEEKLHEVRIDFVEESHFWFTHNGKQTRVEVVESNGNYLVYRIKGQVYESYSERDTKNQHDIINIGYQNTCVSSPNLLSMASGFMKKHLQNNVNGFNQIKSPLFGKVVRIHAEQGSEVREGDVLLILESMKTENDILAPQDGKIEKVHIAMGAQVSENTELLTMSTTH